MPKRSSMFPQSQDATYNLQTEKILLGPPLGRLSDKITDFKTTLHFPHLKLIWNSFSHLVRSRLIAILAHCVEQIQDVSAATEAWSCDARAVSGHGYQFCRELCAATTSPATRQWYSPGQRWEVTCGSRGEMTGGKKGGKREVRWRMMKDHIGFIEAYSATCMVGQPRIHTLRRMRDSDSGSKELHWHVFPSWILTTAESSININ